MRVGFDRAARLLACAGLCLLIAFAAATLVDGLARGVFASPIDAVRDLGDSIVAVAISACFPLAFLEQRNISIDFIASALGPRCKRGLVGVAGVIVLVISVLFAWQFGLYARQLGAVHETTALLEIPKYPFWLLVDMNLWFTVIAQCVVLFGDRVGMPVRAE